MKAAIAVLGCGVRHVGRTVTSNFVRRFLLILPIFIGSTILVFSLTGFVPGGPSPARRGTDGGIPGEAVDCGALR